MEDEAHGVLLLSHCGYSFLEDLRDLLLARNVKCFVLSSQPLPADPTRLKQIEGWSDRLYATASHQLEWADVQRTLEALHAEGEKVRCCITVWEGYRHLMAGANQALGIQDLHPDKVLDLRDKLRTRRELFNKDLSRCRGEKLTQAKLDHLKQDGQRYFIKPVHGIASYAAFPMRPDTQWSTLQQIARDAAQDTVYASAFNGELEFMVESYIDGKEFSFEVMAVGGDIYVVAIHEKCELTETADTVLENCCISPPVSLSQGEVAQGISWVARMLEHLKLLWGCFHIEARYTNAGWDLIEINPRVGGALISHSVAQMNHGCGILAMWLDLLRWGSGPSDARRKTYKERLPGASYNSEGHRAGKVGTFFRVYFAQPGVLERVDVQPLELQPVVSHVQLKAGDEIVPQAREVFLGQMLWKYDLEHQTRTFKKLVGLSAQAIDIRYREPAHQTTLA